MSDIFCAIPDYGILRLEIVLYEYEGLPVEFLCKNEEDILFLCHCTKLLRPGEWLVTKTNVKTVIALLHEEISIREALCAVTDEKYLVAEEDEKVAKKMRCKNVPELCFPEEGLYLEYLTEEAEELLYASPLEEVFSHVSLIAADQWAGYDAAKWMNADIDAWVQNINAILPSMIEIIPTVFEYTVVSTQMGFTALEDLAQASSAWENIANLTFPTTWLASGYEELAMNSSEEAYKIVAGETAYSSDDEIIAA